MAALSFRFPRRETLESPSSLYLCSVCQEILFVLLHSVSSIWLRASLRRSALLESCRRLQLGCPAVRVTLLGWWPCSPRGRSQQRSQIILSYHRSEQSLSLSALYILLIVNPHSLSGLHGPTQCGRHGLLFLLSRCCNSWCSACSLTPVTVASLQLFTRAWPAPLRRAFPPGLLCLGYCSLQYVLVGSLNL